jgi:hypothetical protein
MIRDTIARLGDSPEWRLEVVDEGGTARYLFPADRRELSVKAASVGGLFHSCHPNARLRDSGHHPDDER